MPQLNSESQDGGIAKLVETIAAKVSVPLMMHATSWNLNPLTVMKYARDCINVSHQTLELFSTKYAEKMNNMPSQVRVPGSPAMSPLQLYYQFLVMYPLNQPDQNKNTKTKNI